MKEIMSLCKYHTLLLQANSCFKVINRQLQNGFSPSHNITCLDHLTRHLQESAVYIDKNIVVLNKPYGLKKEQATGTYPEGFKLNPVADSLDQYSLQDSIPQLCEIYNVPMLTVVKCPDRYMSGLTVLATNEKAKKYFDLCIRRSKPKFRFPKYQAVCVGVPCVQEKQHVFGMVMEERIERRKPALNKLKEKKMVFLKTWSKNELKRSDVTLLRVHHKVISKSKDDTASLVEVTSNLNKAHCVRTFLAAQLLTPVLGDHIHSARIKYVYDRPVVGDLWNFDFHMQYLPKKLKEQLQVRRKNEELTIPEHIHLSQIILPGYYGNEEDLVLHCSISTSDAFQYALNNLQLTDRQDDVNCQSEGEHVEHTYRIRQGHEGLVYPL